MHRHRSICIDCVAMCVNDTLTCGANPLFFLDYLVTGKIDPKQAASITEGVANGCILSKVTRIGGETAEMPIPPVFTFLQQTASLNTDELHHIFNMEIGIVACVRPQPPNQPEQLEKTLHLLRNAVFPAYILGEIIPGESIILQPTVQIT